MSLYQMSLNLTLFSPSSSKGRPCCGIFQYQNPRAPRSICKLAIEICVGNWRTIRHLSVLARYETASDEPLQHVYSTIVLYVRLHIATQPNRRANCCKITARSLQTNSHPRPVIFRCQPHRRISESING